MLLPPLSGGESKAQQDQITVTQSHDRVRLKKKMNQAFPLEPREQDAAFSGPQDIMM